MCVCSLTPSNALSIFDAFLPSRRWLRESDAVPPSPSESVSRNVERELLLCSVRPVHASAGISLGAMSFSAGTLSLWAFLVPSLRKKLSAFSLCLSKAMNKKTLHKQAVWHMFLKSLSDCSRLNLCIKWIGSGGSAVDQCTSVQPGPNSAVHIPLKSSLRQESQRLLDTPL